MNELTRRELFQRGALLGAGAWAATRLPAAHADPDTPGPQTVPNVVAGEPAVYAFKIGKLEAYVVHDGAVTSPMVQPRFAPEGKPAEVRRLLQENYQPTGTVTLSVNVLVLREAGGVTLVDAGAGNAFGPTLGRLTQGLAKIGVAPDEVKKVVISHAHGDHISGLLNGRGESQFPNARVLISRREHDYWMGANPDTSQMSATAQERSDGIQIARRVLGAVKPQLQLMDDNGQSGALSLRPLPGHTPGQSGTLIGSGSDSLLVIGDAVHMWALQFAHPEYTIAFDTFPRQAVATRRALFASAAKSRQLLLGAHMPFPGLGHVETRNAAFEWKPKGWV